MNNLRCSVVIPSYNRRALLEMVLEGFERQTVALNSFEVIVVLDGSTDGSVEMLKSWQKAGRLPNLRWHNQNNKGAATARNTGVQMAEAPVIIFLDDDIVPEPDLVEVHLSWHTQNLPIAILGDCLIVRENEEPLIHLMAWAWWEDMYEERARQGRQPGYRDFCAGNVSLRREDFLKIGGFDTGFRGKGGEDFEIGYRLQKAGVEFISDRSARSRHYHRTPVKGVLKATRHEAPGDKLMGEKHPELRPGLRIMYMPEGMINFLPRMGFFAPKLGDPLVWLLSQFLPPLERLKLRWLWHKVFDYLRFYAYWRGVRDAFGSWEALVAYQMDAPEPPVFTMDITNGLPQTLPPLSVDGPCGLVITMQGQTLGILRFYKPITAPLREFLVEQIINQFSVKILNILAESGQTPWEDTSRLRELLTFSSHDLNVTQPQQVAL